MGTLTTLAFDYDGTLARGGRIAEPVEQALRRAREAGLRLVLVTGRTREELRRVCPASGSLFDLTVAENGALLDDGAGLHLSLAAPVDRRLIAALEGRGVPALAGEVLIATEARFEQEVREEIARLGADVRLIRNKDSLMLLPPGISKGTGLSHALGRLGSSAAETIAFGDAENDRELLELAALGIAVGDAVEPLKAIADVVLDEPNGDGVARYVLALVGGG